MKNIHILPTDKPTKLWIDNDINTLVYGLLSIDNIHNCKNQNIYITSDEEIKEGDWYFDGTDLVHKKTKYNDALVDGNKDAKKIILTTDQDLIKNGVQPIDNEFLEWFVNNSSCKQIGVKKYKNNKYWTYEIIIPKEEHKCFDCKGTISKDGICFCNKEEHKQETLEEAAERFAVNQYPYLDEFEKKFIKDDFIKGAKWQQERMYSEEEVEDLIYKVCGTVARLQGITLNGNHIDTAYKQFKDK